MLYDRESGFKIVFIHKDVFDYTVDLADRQNSDSGISDSKSPLAAIVTIAGPSRGTPHVEMSEVIVTMGTPCMLGRLAIFS